jgi:hypothetical protein
MVCSGLYLKLSGEFNFDSGQPNMMPQKRFVVQKKRNSHIEGTPNVFITTLTRNSSMW